MKKIITFLATAVICFSLVAQKPKILNYQEIDNKTIHFGFSIGVNFFDFVVQNSALHHTQNLPYADVSRVEPGFNVNIISELRLTHNLALRFLPGLAFGQRNLNFLYANTSINEMKIESSFLDFPLLIKYSSDRLNNFRPYLIGGVNFRYDMAAKNDYDEESRIFVRLKPFDIYYEFGVGTDFYLTYFRFSTELKLAIGISDVLVHDPAPGNEHYVNAIDKLTSKLFIISFHFE